MFFRNEAFWSFLSALGFRVRICQLVCPGAGWSARQDFARQGSFARQGPARQGNLFRDFYLAWLPLWLCAYAEYLFFGRSIMHKVQGQLLPPRSSGRGLTWVGLSLSLFSVLFIGTCTRWLGSKDT